MPFLFNLVFECETGIVKKSRTEVICFLRIVGKYNFGHATEQCMKIGAKLPEITSSLLQRVVQTKKVIFKYTNRHMYVYEIGYYSLLCAVQMSNSSQFCKHLFYKRGHSNNTWHSNAGVSNSVSFAGHNRRLKVPLYYKKQ